MFFLFRVILSFILCILFAVLIAASFFSQERYLETPALSIDEKSFSGSLSYGSGTLTPNNLSLFETVLTNTTIPQIDTASGSLTFDLTNPGKYLTSFRDLRKNYILQGKGYTITQEGIGEVFVDSETDSEKIFIMSVNTPLKITLTNVEGTEEFTDIFLNPHMYLVFQPSRGGFLKNADALRVQTVYTLGYIDGQVFEIDTNPIVKKYSEGKEAFLQSSLKYLRDRDKLYIQKLQLFLDQDISQIGGFSIANRYMQLFVNKEKKEVFYKNIILSAYNDIMRSKVYDMNTVEQVKKDLQTLKGIDTQSYEELLLLQEEYIAMLNAFRGEDFIIPKILFSFLDEQNGQKDMHEFLLAGFSLFSHYGDTSIFDRETEKKFLHSFQKISSMSNISRSEKTLRSQYFSHFLQEQLLFMLDGDGRNFSMSSFLDLLNSHTEVTRSFYDSEKNTRISTLYAFNDLLTKIDTFLRAHYFKKDRSSDALLVYSSGNRINGGEIDLLRSELAKMFDIYEENKKFLSMTSARDQAIVSGILNSKAKLSEYLLALENYESYVSEYDVSKRNLLSLNTFGSNDDASLSEAKLRSFLSQFQEISMDNASIELGENFYRVEQAYIRGKIFNFSLYPEAANRIQDISINSVASPFIYKLDIIKSDWEEKYKLASIEKKELYNFEKFFIITFFTQKTNQVEEFVNIEVSPNEDKTEIVFKRDILLGEKGEFSTIKDVLPLEYKNIKLSKNEELYDIFIDGAPLSLGEITSGDIAQYQAVMDGEYVLSEENHYFENIKVRVYSGTETNIKPVFGSTPIQIAGRVTLSDFRSRIEQIFTNMRSYSGQYSLLNENYQVEDLVMQFSSRTKKMTFKFDLEGKNYNILVSGDNIDSIYRGTQKLTSKQIPFTEVEKYLQ